MERLAFRTLKFLASLKLAVFIIVALGIISAWGTIVESKYDSEIAQKVVYHSPYMYTVLGLLVINLIAVMIDRIPWKKKHIGFLLAHIGIITILFGAFLTQKRGIDGSISFEIGESSAFIMTSQTVLGIYEWKEGYKKISSQAVDFYLRPPAKYPYSVKVEGGEIKVVDYLPFSIRKTSIEETKRDKDGPALRFQLKNNFTTVTEWMVQQGGEEYVQNFGPTKLILDKKEYKPKDDGNQIVLWPSNGTTLNYKIYNRDKKNTDKKGQVKRGEKIHTQWMDLEVTILNYYEHAINKYEYEPRAEPSEFTIPAIQVEFNGVKKWSGLNSALELFTDKTGYVVSFGNQRIPLGFDLKLLDFKVENYKGTNTAMTYKSHVEIPNKGDFFISMNEPLKYEGYTFYQASFQQDETGKPIASILSVNRDPGRYIKYLGAIIMIAGTIHLFYNRKLYKPTEVT